MDIGGAGCRIEPTTCSLSVHIRLPTTTPDTCA